MASTELLDRLKALEEVEEQSPREAARLYKELILSDNSTGVETIKAKESTIQKLSNLYVKLNEAESLRLLLTELRPLFLTFSKAKTAKVVRGIIDSIAKVPNSVALQVRQIWCSHGNWILARSLQGASRMGKTGEAQFPSTENRSTFSEFVLRESRILICVISYWNVRAHILLLLVLHFVFSLVSEVKRLDDKLLLVDIHLLESRAHHALRNIPRSKAALTAARTAANAVYIPPALQAEIDTQSGLLHAEEHDYKTAYSYFYEAFEQSSALEDPKALFKLKYMLLCKIMTNNAADVPSIVNSKTGLKYLSLDIDAMKAVARAYQNRSLKEFQMNLNDYKEQLQGDPIVNSHLTVLYDTLLQQNLGRLIEPFSRVEISHIAKLIELDSAIVEKKLSQMILDKAITGTLDQGTGCLELFEAPKEDQVYIAALDTFRNTGKVVDVLFARSEKIAS
eukprot:g4472.t1